MAKKRTARRAARKRQVGDVIRRVDMTGDDASALRWRKLGCTCDTLDIVYLGVTGGFTEAEFRHDRGCPAAGGKFKDVGSDRAAISANAGGVTKAAVTPPKRDATTQPGASPIVEQPTQEEPPAVTPLKRDINSILGVIPNWASQRTADQKLFLMADSLWTDLELPMGGQTGRDARQRRPDLSPEIIDYALSRLAEARRSLLKVRREASVTECAECGKSFTPIRSTARYCSAACRQRAYRRRDA